MNSSNEIDFSAVFGKELDPQLNKILESVFINKILTADDKEISFQNSDKCNVIRNIPRFVPNDLYTASFSYQWKKYTETQLDSTQGSSLTEKDLINKTGLRPNDVKGKLVLDAGVGIGRHSEILAKWGALVIGIDLSEAVETARDNLKSFSNAVVIQANIAQLPFIENCFDHIVSIGVLHHTPDTKTYTKHLIPPLKQGGRLSIWLYPPGFSRRGEWVPLISKLPMDGFKEWSEWIVDIARNNRGNLLLESFIKQFPFATHHPTHDRSVLALFDGYTPTFHWTHSNEEVENWFIDAGFTDIRINPIPTSVSGYKPITKSSVKKNSNANQDINFISHVENIKSRSVIHPQLGIGQSPFTAPKALSKLTIEITTFCNLKCSGCPRTSAMEKDSWSDVHMELSVFQSILDNLPQVDFVTLHGIGEPTLHPEFNEIVSMAKASGKFKRMKMTTNALARSVKYYEQSIASGLDEFWVSVDSLNQEICDKMRFGTKAEKLKRRLKDLIAAQLPVHISMVVSSENFHDIPQTLRQLYEAGAPPVHMQEFQDFGNPYGLMNSDQRKRFLHELSLTIKELPGMKIIPPSYASPQGTICTAPWFRPAISVQGYLTPCCTTFDPSQFGFISLSTNSFQEAWQHDGVIKWIEDFIDNNTSICQGCGLNPRKFGIDNVLGTSGKTGSEQHVIKLQSN